MKLLKFFTKWLIDLFKTKYKISYKEELPDEIQKDEIVLIGENRQYDFLAMVCPCGCKKVIQLSLVQGDNPRWNIYIKTKAQISAHPSIWLTKGCKSHFFIKNSKIVWAEKRSFWDHFR